MTDATAAHHEADDAHLLNMVRAGDPLAFGVLSGRHISAARRLAGELAATPAEAEDMVAEAFARVLEATRRGGGPANSVRPYVLTALRRAHSERLSGRQGTLPGEDTPAPDTAEPGEPLVDPALAGLEEALIARSYFSLPERWSAVLWHTDIEGSPPGEVALLLGLTRNGVGALRRRATDGLRQSYLQIYMSRLVRPECRPVADRLGAYIRDEQPGRDTDLVSEHLQACEDCRAVYRELTDVTASLRGVIAPLVLGSAAAAYLSGAAGRAAEPGASPAALAMPDARHAWRDQPDDRSGLAAGAAGTAGPSPRRAPRRRRQLSRASRRLIAGTGVAVLAVAAAAIAATLTGPGSAPTGAHRPSAPAVAAQGSPSAATSATASPTPSPSRSGTPAMRPSPAPAPPQTSPPVVARALTPALAASVSVTAYSTSGRVHFAVTNTGSASTGSLTVTISLPAGTSASGTGGQPGSVSAHGSGWNCQSTSGGLTCTHGPVQAGQSVSGWLFISLGPNSCGQPVRLTATSGAQAAQAAQDIPCGGNGQ